MAENYAIETYLRIRPCEGDNKIVYKIRDVTASNGANRQFLKLEIPADADPSFIHNNESGMMTFEFDRVFDEMASQEDLYSAIASKKVTEAIDGMNSTIFAYGQTGNLFANIK